MKAKVSVIVPVYNTELYLEECLESIINQTFKELEIILVNDGSTDRSLEIIERYALKYNRIIVLNQPNCGVSAARNAGIDKSSGKYLLFVDSDDTIVADAIEVLYGEAGEKGEAGEMGEKGGVDIVIGNTLFLYPDGRKSANSVFSRGKTIDNGLVRTGEEAYQELMKHDKYPPLTWLYFIRRDVVITNQLYFQTGIINEDEIWCLKAILSAKRVLLLDFNYYLYRQREGSIMHSDNYSFRVKSLFAVVEALNQYAEELRKKNFSKETVAFIYVRIFFICSSIGALNFRDKTIAVPDFSFFSELLKKIYPLLSHSQQKYCLSAYCNTQKLLKSKINIKPL